MKASPAAGPIADRSTADNVVERLDADMDHFSMTNSNLGDIEAPF